MSHPWLIYISKRVTVRELYVLWTLHTYGNTAGKTGISVAKNNEPVVVGYRFVLPVESVRIVQRQ